MGKWRDTCAISGQPLYHNTTMNRDTKIGRHVLRVNSVHDKPDGRPSYMSCCCCLLLPRNTYVIENIPQPNNNRKHLSRVDKCRLSWIHTFCASSDEQHAFTSAKRVARSTVVCAIRARNLADSFCCSCTRATAVQIESNPVYKEHVITDKVDALALKVSVDIKCEEDTT